MNPLWSCLYQGTTIYTQNQWGLRVGDASISTRGKRTIIYDEVWWKLNWFSKKKKESLTEIQNWWPLLYLTRPVYRSCYIFFFFTEPVLTSKPRPPKQSRFCFFFLTFYFFSSKVLKNKGNWWNWSTPILMAARNVIKRHHANGATLFKERNGGTMMKIISSRSCLTSLFKIIIRL